MASHRRESRTLNVVQRRLPLQDGSSNCINATQETPEHIGGLKSMWSNTRNKNLIRATILAKGDLGILDAVSDNVL